MTGKLNNPEFDHLGDRQSLTYIAPDTVLVEVGGFADACTLIVGCQCSGCTLATTAVWDSELAVCSALAMARISYDYHRDLLDSEILRGNHGND